MADKLMHLIHIHILFVCQSHADRHPGTRIHTGTCRDTGTTPGHRHDTGTGISLHNAHQITFALLLQVCVFYLDCCSCCCTSTNQP